MRKLIIVVLVGLLAVTGCGRAGGGGSSAEWPRDRTFVSTAVTERAAVRPLVPDTRIELMLASDGKFSANAGCNLFTGPAHLDGDRLVITELSSTRKGCPTAEMEQDAWLSTILAGKPTWRSTGDALVLRAGDVEIRLARR